MHKVRCRTGEVFTDYNLYLRSKHWRDVKRRYYSKYGYYCKRCGYKSGLQLHHKTYKNIGDEKLTDLESLCVRCHRIEHGLSKLNQPLKPRKKWNWKVKAVIVAVVLWWIVRSWYYGE